MSCILLTGGFGYIGSHSAVVLADKKQKFVIVDNFSNCKKDMFRKLEKITKQEIKFYDLDIKETQKLKEIIIQNKITSVIHFAALKSVSDSLIKPLEYYDVNVVGTLSLLSAMKSTGVKKFLFSSSASIYGEPKYCPIDEKHLLNALNPYAQTKIIIENILKDLVKVETDWSVVCLRYFNPIGAHESKLIGDDPLSSESSNLMPAILKVFKGFENSLKILEMTMPPKMELGLETIFM